MLSAIRILVPFDFTEIGRTALDTALWMAGTRGGEVQLLYVEEGIDRAIKRDLEDEAEAIGDIIDADEGALLRIAGEALAALREREPGLEDVRIRARVAGGGLVDVVLGIVDEERVDLVITGTHGRSGMLDRLRGSTSEQLVARATCSVMVLKPEGFPYMRD